MINSYQGFIQWGGGGELPPQNTQLPPQKEREKEETRERRKRKREREVVGEGEHDIVYFVKVQVTSIVLYFMT